MVKYTKADITQLVILAFKGVRYNEVLQQKLSVTDEEISHGEEILLSAEGLAALTVLFNAIYPSSPQQEQGSLICTAEKYPLEYLRLSIRPYKALRQSKYFSKIMPTVADLLLLTDEQIVSIRGVGKHSRAYIEIRERKLKFIEDFNAGLID